MRSSHTGCIAGVESRLGPVRGNRRLAPSDPERRTILTSESRARGARKGAANGEALPEAKSAETLKDHILAILDDAKAEGAVTIDLRGKSPMADFMIVASGRSDRHVGAIAEQIQTKLRGHGFGRVRIEGLARCDWVLIDAGDVIVHVFRPEVRTFYNLEKMWSPAAPEDRVAV